MFEESQEQFCSDPPHLEGLTKESAKRPDGKALDLVVHLDPPKQHLTR